MNQHNSKISPIIACIDVEKLSCVTWRKQRTVSALFPLLYSLKILSKKWLYFPVHALEPKHRSPWVGFEPTPKMTGGGRFIHSATRPAGQLPLSLMSESWTILSLAVRINTKLLVCTVSLCGAMASTSDCRSEGRGFAPLLGVWISHGIATLYRVNPRENTIQTSVRTM